MNDLVDDLSDSDMQEDGLTMIGSEVCVVRAGVQATPVVGVRWLVSRVVLKKVACNIAEQYGEMTIDCVYLGNANTVQYDVSYSKETNAVWVKFDLVDNGVLMLEQTHSINLYLDMNSSLNKNSRDNMSYHISIYPGKPVSKYNGWDTVNNKESNKYIYEDSAAETWAYIYGNSIYIKISCAINKLKKLIKMKTKK